MKMSGPLKYFFEKLKTRNNASRILTGIFSKKLENCELSQNLGLEFVTHDINRYKGVGIKQQHFFFLFFFPFPQECPHTSKPFGQDLPLTHMPPCFIQELPVKI